MKKIKKNILIVSPGFPRWKGDYTHPMVYNLAKILSNYSHKITIVTLHYPKIPLEEKMDNLKIVRVKYAPEKFEILGTEGGLIDDIRRSFFCKILLIPMLISFAWQIFKESKETELILCQWIPTGIVTLPTKILRRKPLILHSRTYPDTIFWKLIYRILLPFSDGVIFNSKDNKSITDKLYSHPITKVIGSGINISQFRNKNVKRTNSSTCKLITVARLVEFKGLEYLIKAISILKAKKRNLKLTIVGDGPLRKDLEKLSRQLEVENLIDFVGAKNHYEIPNLMWKNDVFIISSIIDSKGRTEGFGAVILEAMAASLPVVATSVGGITDIVNNENGILVPEKCPKSISNAIEKLITNKKLASNYKKNGLDFVMKNFSDESIINSYNEFFLKILVRHNIS